MPRDELELRGPIGGYFVWEESLGGPLFLTAGGSGVAPFRAMLRHWSAANSSVPTRLLYSSRSVDDLIYGKELLDGRLCRRGRADRADAAVAGRLAGAPRED